MDKVKSTKKTKAAPEVSVEATKVSGHVKGATKALEGVVVSNKMDKTLVVEIIRRFPHPKYGKIIYKTKRFKVHSDTKVEVGKTIQFVPTVKMSKTKAFKILEK